MKRTALYFPLEGTLHSDIAAWLALSDAQGQPLPGKTQEWVRAAITVAKGMQASLRNDGDLQLSPT